MGAKVVELTSEEKERLVNHLQQVARQGERVGTLKEVRSEASVRVAFIRPGYTLVLTVVVDAKYDQEVMVTPWREPRVALCPDYPCIVRA